ncbi:MAG: NUDIX domain-containing protein [Cytophagales bacterium]|nr:NUDIX domain-containing protein [Cytophagales bacterium]
MEDIYRGKVRVRVCGLLINNKGILLLKHLHLGPKGHIWAPPGGGVAFGHQATDVLRQEFLEETGLIIEVGNFLFTNEYIDEKYHAIELFFEVQAVDGQLKLGTDPELAADQQILADIKYFNDFELANEDQDNLHNLFRETRSLTLLKELRGFFKFHRRES